MRTINIPTNPAPAKMQKARSGNFDPCVICGIAVSKPKFQCHVIGGGSLALLPEDEALFAADHAAQAGDLGAQPVGTDCLRRFPQMKPYVFPVGAVS